jgi:hypothetical protein
MDVTLVRIFLTCLRKEMRINEGFSFKPIPRERKEPCVKCVKWNLKKCKIGISATFSNLAEASRLSFEKNRK